MADLSRDVQENKYVEVQFKNTRKQVFLNPLGLELHKDDIVAVEGTPGLDVGRVTLTGMLAALRYRRLPEQAQEQMRQIFRLATSADIERWEEAKSREHGTMIETRRIAERMGLNMKIGDVEYQGDGSKAIFYYIADARVDFRQLIRVLADTFHVRIEMKQIGARQEAGRIGGIGPCGRPLCCTQWITTFKSVNTSAARFQELPLNPEKLTGQCAKLKCCANFEVNTYLEAQKKMPQRSIIMQTEGGDYHFFKWDLLRQEITYVPQRNSSSDSVTISVRRAWEIIEMNKKGEKPKALLREGEQPKPVSADILEENSLSRFDNDKPRTRKRKNKHPKNSQPKTTDSDNAAPKDKEPTSLKEGGGEEQSRPRNNKENRNPNSNPQRGNQRSQRRRRPNNGGNREERESRPNQPTQSKPVESRKE